MMRMPGQRTPVAGSPLVGDGEAIDDGFEVDETTPVLAVGTHSDLSERARAARIAAASPPPAPPPSEDVAALAHDLKNPLTIIMLEANQIEQRLGARATPAILRGLERIAQNAAYIDRLVSDMLDVASADAGKLDLRIERLDLARILRDAIDRAVATPDRERVRLEIRSVVYAEGDPVRIERVVTNLLGNAFKYSEHGRAVTLRLDQRGPYACVSVIDQGPGLSADESRRVFERYRRATTGTQHGYGLGLYTCRRIIEAHRGRIGVVSTVGRGSRFYFELPLLQRPPQPSQS
jgi:signal transduction histidine kinase